jgi:PD-(D/E)XK nuclease superfamily
MAELANDFSWSRSRDNTFQECKRKYFYQYYGSWGGWEAGVSPEVRRLYILKQLASRQMWAGRVVHEAIEMALHAFRHDRDIPVEPFIGDVIERMRGEWRTSRAGHYRDSPKTLALFEHEYRIDLKPEVWQALSRGVAQCLRNFFRLPLLATIRRTAREHWSIEHWSKVFEFEGTPIWMAPDFGFWTEEGRLGLVDWKTGGSNPDATAFQLGCYALYAREVLDVPPARIDLFEVNLREPEVTPLTWDESRLESIKEQLRLSIRSMKAYLADPDTNAALIADFERAEDLRICRWCNFRAVCRPELTS